MGKGAAAGDEAQAGSWISWISEGHYHNKKLPFESRFRGTRGSHVSYFVRASQQVCGVQIASLVSWGTKLRLRAGRPFAQGHKAIRSPNRMKARRPDSQL